MSGCEQSASYLFYRDHTLAKAEAYGQCIRCTVFSRVPFFVRQGALLSGYRCLFISYNPNSITLFKHSAAMLSGGQMPDGRLVRLRGRRVSHFDRNRQGYATLLGASALSSQRSHNGSKLRQILRVALSELNPPGRFREDVMTFLMDALRSSRQSM